MTPAYASFWNAAIDGGRVGALFTVNLIGEAFNRRVIPAKLVVWRASVPCIAIVDLFIGGKPIELGPPEMGPTGPASYALRCEEQNPWNGARLRFTAVRVGHFAAFLECAS
jgi:hypothetical protein